MSCWRPDKIYYFVIPSRRLLPARNLLWPAEADFSRDKAALRNDRLFKLHHYLLLPFFLIALRRIFAIHSREYIVPRQFGEPQWQGAGSSSSYRL
jgi:hypothetical protein